ncbi:MAG: hypothetical protein ACE5OQ_17380 [Woeseia sp.]
MNAAEKLRQYSARSNDIHQEYLGDPELLERYQRFVAWQIDYLLPLYEDLRESPDYAAAVDFVVSDLMGIGVSRRDHDIARIVPIMSRMLPDTALHTVAAAMELNARVLAINVSICRQLYGEKPVDSDFSEFDYCSACRRASSLDESIELIQLIRELGRKLEHIVHIPMIRLTLKAMHAPARLAGFIALQSFLEKGYSTFVALEDVDQFLDDLTRRMNEVFTRIFTEPLERLNRHIRVIDA